MALRFNPLPFRNDERSGHDEAQDYAQMLASLGDTFDVVGRDRRENQQMALQQQVTQMGLEDKYGSVGVRKILRPAAPPRRILQSTEGAQVQPMAPRSLDSFNMADPRDFAEARRMYGSSGVSPYLEAQKYEQEGEARTLEKRYKESMIAENLAQADKSRREPSLSPDQMFRLQERQQRMDDANARLDVPGYNRGAIRPKEDEAAKLRDAVARLDKFEKGIQAMKGYVKDSGTFQMFGTAGANMNGLATDLQLDAKELYNLGVLNGPDLMLIQKTIADPSSMRSLFTRSGTRQAELDQVLSRMKQGVASKMQATGYTSTAPTTTASGGFDSDKERRYQEWKARQGSR